MQEQVRKLEVEVKDAINKWEKESKLFSQDGGHLSAQKRVWSDFLNNPKLLEANLEAISRKLNQ